MCSHKHSSIAYTRKQYTTILLIHCAPHGRYDRIGSLNPNLQLNALLQLPHIHAHWKPAIGKQQPQNTGCIIEDM